MEDLKSAKEDAQELLRTYKQRKRDLKVERDEEMADIADSREEFEEMIERKREERAEDKALTAAGIPWFPRKRRRT